VINSRKQVMNSEYPLKGNPESAKLLTGVFVFLLLSLTGYGQAVENGDERSEQLLTYKNRDGNVKVVFSAQEWETKRAQIIAGMEQAMGALPPRKELNFDVQIRDSIERDLYILYDISFTVAEGENVPAYWYVPKGRTPGKKYPAILALHPTGDLGKKLTDGQGKPDRAYAKELADRGYVVIAPDYPSFGDLKGHDFKTDRYQSGTMQAIFNHMRCVDFLQSLDYVDPERIGVIGHSLGGHNAMFVAAFDDRLKVVVSSCGWTLMDYYDIGERASAKFGGRLGPWAQDRYMPLLRDRFGLDGGKIPFDFDEVIAVIAPRPFLSVSPVRDANFDVAGVRKGILSAANVYHLMNADENLSVRYPDAAHDFTPASRLDAYRFIDKALDHSPLYDEIR